MHVEYLSCFSFLSLMNTKNPPMFVETIQMELDAFIGAIAHRITEYLNAADAPGKVSQPVPHTSLSKTSDLKLPIEGNGPTESH